jgi:hypothetical protein
MRALSIALLLSTTAAFAQLGAPAQPATGFQPTWSMGAQSFGPTLTGHAQGMQDGQPIALDLTADLGLNRSKTTPGFFLDYQGKTFGFQFSSGSAEYRGNQVVNRTVTVDGTTYTAGTQVQSHLKLTSLDGTWTIKLVSEADAWLGLDLGAQLWTIDLDTRDVPAFGPAASTSNQIKSPIPQIGLSGGSRGYNGAFESKAYIHYMTYKKAKYTMYGLDLRVFPVRWFGLRAFYESDKLDIPNGSVKDDLELQLNRKGIGFGAVLRF